ncbi:MAG: hypothetical protein ACPGYP_00630 [Solirubrobacterales bacterium]
MEPATISSAASSATHSGVAPALSGSALTARFGAFAGEYRYAVDQRSAIAAIDWMLGSAEVSPLTENIVVGVDIETSSLKPADGRIRLCQLAAGSRAVVIDAFAFDPWPLIRSALIDLRPDWIAHNAEFEQSWFARHAGFTLTPMFDTRWVYIRERARRFGPEVGGSSSLQAVCAELLDFELSKEQRLSDWTAPVLSAAQVEYAALDALVLPVLRARLERDAIEFGWTAEIAAATQRSHEEADRFR